MPVNLSSPAVHPTPTPRRTRTCTDSLFRYRTILWRRTDRVRSDLNPHCNGPPLLPPQQSAAKTVRTADSSALLEWRNKLIQHYWADSRDESGQLGATGILADLQSWLVGKTEGWGEAVEIRHHVLSAPHIMMLSCRVSGTILC